MDYVGFMCNGLPLTSLCSFGECLGEEGEHFFDALALEEAVGGQVTGHTEGEGVRCGVRAKDGDADHFHC